MREEVKAVELNQGDGNMGNAQSKADNHQINDNERDLPASLS